MTFWNPGEEVKGTSFKEIKSKRRFGVELEVGQCPRRLELNGSPWGAKAEQTAGVHTEFISSILQGDDGLNWIRKFYNLAIDKENKAAPFKINNGCGFHLHVDCSDLTDAELKRVVAAFLITYKAWKLFVPHSRVVNRFCVEDKTPISKLEENVTFLSLTPKDEGKERYRWLNWAAYRRHKTFENRLHGGTLSALKVINWIKANVWLADWAKTQDISSIKKHFGFKQEEVVREVSNNDLECNCEDCKRDSGITKVTEIVETMPEPEEIFLGLSKIWGNIDGGELATFYSSRIRKHLNTHPERKFDFDKLSGGKKKVKEMAELARFF